MSNNKRLDKLEREIDELRARVENLKNEAEKREAGKRDNIFVSSIPDDHIPVDHYW